VHPFYLGCTYSTMSAISDGASVSTSEALEDQWRMPQEVLGLLLIVGPEIVQKALSQCAPNRLPVAFSFGWVGYSFSAMTSLLGEGRLMSDCDYPCKVINLASRQGRENRSFLLGRLLQSDEEALRHEYALVVTVHDVVDHGQEKEKQKEEMKLASHGKPTHTDVVAQSTTTSPMVQTSFTRTRTDVKILSIAGMVIMLQIIISAIPWILHASWRVFLITMGGTILALLTGLLPQWRAENFAARRNSNKTIAILRGNGCRHVMIVQGDKDLEASLDVEDLAASESARLARPWERYGWFVRRPDPPLPQQTNGSLGAAEKGATESKTIVMTHKLLSYLPVDFWITRIACGLLLAFWVTLLICVSGMTSDTWYLFAVGALGSLHNAYTAATGMGARSRHLPLTRRFYIAGFKVMDVLMDLERMRPGAGEALVEEFFPGGMDESRGEKEWWNDVGKRWVFNGQGQITSTSCHPLPAMEDDAVGSIIGIYDEKRLQHPIRRQFGLHNRSE